MSSEERGAYIALIASLITMVYFGVPIWENTRNGSYAAADGLALWGRDVLWLMGGGIVIAIIAMIVANILVSIITNTEDLEMLTDERDRMIGRRGILATLSCISVGFIAAVIGLAMGWTAIAALNVILMGMIVGSFVSELLRIAHYRLGL